MQRIFFFLLTNIAVIAVASLLLSIFNIAPYLSASGINYQSLLIFSAVFGFSGSIISLLISKWMAKNAFGIKIIQQAKTPEEQFIFQTVQTLARQSSLGMPEVGIYDSPEANAFATGWNRNHALVAVSTGLLNGMEKDEIEAVLGHEIAHIANGDMVTLTLIQGVVNTFVIFFARIAAYAVQVFFSKDNEEEGISTLAYSLTSIVFEILFGILASMIVMAFSRHREFRADSGSAKFLGKEKMIKALQKLETLQDRLIDPRGKSFATMKISDKPSGFLSFFSSHPPLKDRIEALKKQ
ncbi:MAG: protease HtpX [Candidatus Moraniibacteriota bacterium]|nr:MAG: protease HtpX [Candidatus Moranbacteria bacterium]